ncbi:hypothetical protein G6027_01225 [Dietzia sp. SLG310A2-38A2]|uniref:hypothetical protein n=1 Tax=Dietzia sp. SLG310A2-38A2 TaxID=1630643 RepID=UPI0015FAD15A|nr:hypothetical protein [Dietzia sp. SLG310A2-38A2]MBB1029533.1 hypothetical protein [Dietzia sp. SLG310A2-38A2]
MSTSRALKGLTAAAASAALAIGAAGSAAAQTVTVVPGDNGDGRTVIVNNSGMDVDVVSVDRAAGTAQVTMTNNLGFTVFCEAASQDPANRFGGSISTAPVVESSVEYYQRFQNVKAEDVRITMSVLGSTGTMVAELWPLVQFLPQGSVGEISSDAVALRSQITQANTAAKVQGLYGTTPAFAVTNGNTVTRNIALGPPSTQPRGVEKVGFFTMCAQGTNSAAAQGTAQLYAWSAFEEGWPPPVIEPEESGNITSGSLGSLGGNGDGQPPVNGDPDNEDPDNGGPGDDEPGDDEPGADE